MNRRRPSRLATACLVILIANGECTSSTSSISSSTFAHVVSRQSLRSRCPAVGYYRTSPVLVPVTIIDISSPATRGSGPLMVSRQSSSSTNKPSSDQKKRAKKTNNIKSKRQFQLRRGEFNNLLDDLAKERTYEAAERAENLLFERLRNATSDSSSSHAAGNGSQRATTKTDSGSFDVATFNIVLNAWSKSGNAPRAAVLLGRMEYMNGLGILSFGPNEVSYSTVADAWSHSDQDGGVAEAGRVLHMMQSMREEDGTNNNTSNSVAGQIRRRKKKEDIVSFNQELDLFARERFPEAAETAETMLFEKLREAAISSSPLSDDHIGCDVISFNTVLNAWSRCGDAQRASALLGRLEHLSDTLHVLPFGPNSVSYATCISAWARSGLARAPFEAEMLLDRVVRSFYAGGNGDDDGGGDDAGSGRRIVPTIHMYASVINAWSRSKRSDAARRAERILNRLEDLYSKSSSSRDLDEIKPNAVVYTSIINCWGRSRDATTAVEHAEAIFERMKNSTDPDIQPNEFTYAVLINAWSNSGRGVKAAERADELVREIETTTCESSSDDSRVVPNVYIYTNAIKAWARSDHAECGIRAEQILNRMMIASEHDERVRPNVHTFTSVIDAWISQGKGEHGSEGALNAYRILRKMIDLTNECCENAKPDRFVYSKVIKALEACASDRKALSRAEELRNQMPTK